MPIEANAVLPNPAEIAHEVIESVVSLTEQRDELTLLRSLLDVIIEVLPGVEVAMVWLVAGVEPGQWVADSARPLPGPMFPVADWLVNEVVRLNADDQIRQCEQDGLCYVISSLGVKENSRKAIAIRQAEWTPPDLRIVRGMIRIHANYARLLFDSERDTLTGLYNRKKMEQKLGELLTARMQGRHRAKDSETSDYLAIFDIDHFKRINDNHGHLIGDEVLLVFAGLVRNTLRDVDWVFRYGGEEFVALIKGVSHEAIGSILERVRDRVENHGFPQVGQVTVSTGYTAVLDQGLPHDVFEEADKALYYAKEHGRNRVCGYQDLVASGELVRETRQSGSVELF